MLVVDCSCNLHNCCVYHSQIRCWNGQDNPKHYRMAASTAQLSSHVHLTQTATPTITADDAMSTVDTAAAAPTHADVSSSAAATAIDATSASIAVAGAAAMTTAAAVTTTTAAVTSAQGQRANIFSEIYAWNVEFV
jgi:hypothetical protein